MAPMPSRYLIPVMLLAGILFSCQDGLEGIEAVQLKGDIPDRTIEDAEYFFSDSGEVQNRLRAGLVFEFHSDTPYTELSQGVELVFFRDNGVEGSVLTSDKGVIRRDGRIMHVIDSVKFRNYKGEVLHTNSLTWMQDKDSVFTNDPVMIIRHQDTINGIGLRANQDFSRYTIENISGGLYVEPNEETR